MAPLLTTAFPRATIIGLGLSNNMLAVARARVATARFIKQNIETWQSNDKVDLIFANAARRFVPNHHELIVRHAKQYSRAIACFDADGGG